MSDNSIRVLYIMGFGRSGSTVLDTVLGNHSEIESVGELFKLPNLGWIDNAYCACGHRTNHCSFWSSVKKEWLRYSEVTSVKDYLELQSNLDKNWRPLKDFTPPDSSSEEFKKYAIQTLTLYKSIAKVSEKPIIVDSSKNLLRAFILSFVPGIDLYVIHLIRDPRGVAWSKRKAIKKNEQEGVKMEIKPMSVWRSTINWIRINLRADWVRKQLESNKSIQIVYEDFIKHPTKILDRIGNLIEEDFTALSKKLESDSILSIGHTIAGNRLRMAGNLRLKLDEDWKKQLSAIDRCIIWLVTIQMINRYNKAE